jgi:hypothetical protein
LDRALDRSVMTALVRTQQTAAIIPDAPQLRPVQARRCSFIPSACRPSRERRIVQFVRACSRIGDMITAPSYHFQSTWRDRAMLRSARPRATDSILPTSGPVYPSTSARQRRAPSSSRRIQANATSTRFATSGDRCRKTLACSTGYVDALLPAAPVPSRWPGVLPARSTLSARRARSRRHPSRGTIESTISSGIMLIGPRSNASKGRSVLRCVIRA